MVKNTVSQAWRLGRAVALANKTANIGRIGSVLVDALGGARAAKVLFSGKIVEVNRRIYKGHTVGEIVVKAVAAEEEEEEDPTAPKEKFEGTVTSTSPAALSDCAKSYSTVLTPVQFRSRMRTCMSSTTSTATRRQVSFLPSPLILQVGQADPGRYSAVYPTSLPSSTISLVRPSARPTTSTACAC